jgi:cytochrome b6-f complex iron-sulfur subunit
MDRPTERMGRRRFLVLAGVGVGGAAGAVACGPAASVAPASVGDVPAGNVSSLPVGSLRAVSGEPVCIGRDSGGVYAMTLTCTHAGCDIGATGDVSPSGLLCGCHGSRFDANGNVVSGPAPSPLDHFAVTVDSSGNLTIHGGQVVDAGQRLAVGG